MEEDLRKLSRSLVELANAINSLLHSAETGSKSVVSVRQDIDVLISSLQLEVNQVHPIIGRLVEPVIDFCLRAKAKLATTKDFS